MASVRLDAVVGRGVARRALETLWVTCASMLARSVGRREYRGAPHTAERATRGDLQLDLREALLLDLRLDLREALRLDLRLDLRDREALLAERYQPEEMWLGRQNVGHVLLGLAGACTLPVGCRGRDS